MRKLKKRDERKQILDARIYPVVRIATKTPQRPHCWSTHEEYRFPVIKSLPWTQSQSPWSRSSLREIAHEGGVSVPAMLSTSLHTKPEGRWLVGEPLKLQRWSVHQDTMLVHSRTTAQGSKPCLITHSRANLALTFTKFVLRTKDLIFLLLDGLKLFLDVYEMSWDSSKLQMAGVRHIYRPPTQTSH